MITEVILSATHILLIMGWVTFLAAQTALCHIPWNQSAVLLRLMRLDKLAWVCALLLLVSGFARMFLGMKGWLFFATQWALYAKLAVFFLMLVLEFWVSFRYRSWFAQGQGQQQLPEPAQIKKVYRVLMIQTHLMVALPILAALLARGIV